ncbi:hypothetical protein O9H85_04450 [Paenibacillus filicis]|uniref:CobB/CobQ-like glutamine amidotransferase domain-containing protein n=1 Tax=Paenibacillus gyeongsangnamensis TaxID=3388067 RepID=A0ABT4Q4R9_9BACL|nr:hypothetical protein [Paenibacillus filicis]MCZ8511690.1 hypothetical protein [Paenibacillus filicis]
MIPRCSIDIFAPSPGLPITGYEIHMGRTTFLEPVRHPFAIRPTGTREETAEDGVISENRLLWGTYAHGILHNDDFRRAWLNRIREARGWLSLTAGKRFSERREAAFDRLTEHVRSH